MMSDRELFSEKLPPEKMEFIEATPAQLIEMKIDQLERENKKLLELIERTITDKNTEYYLLHQKYVALLEKMVNKPTRRTKPIEDGDDYD